MKKLAIVIVMILIFSGCASKIDENQLIYNSYVEELTELKLTTTSKKIVDVDIELEEEKGEISYRVTIDNPRVVMNDVEAIVYHTSKTSDIYPTIGVFDKKINLVPNLKKNKDDNVKGVVLAGYIKSKKSLDEFHTTFKVMILYNDKNNERKKIYYSKKV